MPGRDRPRWGMQKHVHTRIRTIIEFGFGVRGASRGRQDDLELSNAPALRPRRAQRAGHFPAAAKAGKTQRRPLGFDTSPYIDGDRG